MTFARRIVRPRLRALAAFRHAGEYPFTRGIHPEMYRLRRWTMRQYAGYASAKETNAGACRVILRGTLDSRRTGHEHRERRQPDSRLT